MNVLCVMAHPDDETIACGGTLAKHSAACDTVALQFFTDGVGSRNPYGSRKGNLETKHRHAESVAAAHTLGIDPGRVKPGHFDDQRLDTYSLLDLARSVGIALKECQPDVVYTHWPGDLNQDHRRVAEAVLIATRPVAGSTVRRVLAGEVPESTSQAFGFGYPFQPNVFVMLDGGALGRKTDAMAAYRSEAREYPHPRSTSALVERAAMWGGLAGCQYAEAFMLLREVVR